MKKLMIPAIMVVIAQCVCAVEYVTLSNSSRSVNIATGALVEIVGFTNWRDEDVAQVEFTFANGDTTKTYIQGFQTAGALPILKQQFYSLSKVRVLDNGDTGVPIFMALTLKITPAAEIDSAGPKTVLVIPEGSTGDYDVVIESSGDMVTWTPMHSQGVTGSGPQHFFRTRIVKK